MKAPDDRGLTAQRLRAVRMAAGFTNQTKAAAHVRAETGVSGLADSVWAEYESGRRDENGKLLRPMSQKHREAIESVFGPLGDTQPERGEDGTTPDLAALLVALTAQADTVTALLEELRTERSERLALKTQVDDLTQLVANLAEDLAATRRGGGGSGGSHGEPTPRDPSIQRRDPPRQTNAPRALR